MDEIKFIGEQLGWGQAGNFLIALAGAAVVFSCLSYYFQHKERPGLLAWKTLGRAGFILHGISIFGVIAILFHLLLDHRFEYHYVWDHSSSSMEKRYVFASFWEGQQGSFLLWMFWQIVIGLVLLFRAGKWEAPVMIVFGLVQLWLTSMLWGIVVALPGMEEFRIGSNPFVLTREHPDLASFPFVKMIGYLENLDGQGLNPALQNYWMTIHPPTLFLGFALTLVPFAYALAGLKSGDLKGWVKPALPWAFTCIAILGLGILMGGAWAYEALNFGGFWVWDPVENTSLMPWLIMVAGAHLMLVFRNRGRYLQAATFLTVFSFLLTLYSTFTTRSGILGDASVHAFTDLGMSRQLQLFLMFFMWLPSYFFIREQKYKFAYLVTSFTLLALGFILEFEVAVTFIYIVFFLGGITLLMWLWKKYEPAPPGKEKEESIWSREFWMFIGALVLVISTLHLMIETSKPVFNTLFKTNYAPGDVDDYNKFQVIFALLITFFMGFSQFLLYRKTEARKFYSRAARSLIISLLVVIACAIAFSRFRNPAYIVLTFTSLFSVLANIDYIIMVVKGKWKLMGASIAHAGFGLIILGSVISAGHKNIISANSKQLNLETLNPDFKNNENVMLHKGDTIQMGEYYLCYSGDSSAGINRYFRIDYFKEKDGKLEKEFTLFPRVQVNLQMGNVAEPSTLHRLHQDIFTHVVYVEKEKLQPVEVIGAYKQPQTEEIQESETIITENAFITLRRIELLEKPDTLDTENLNVLLRANILISNFKGDTAVVTPEFMIRDNRKISGESIDEINGLKITFDNFKPGMNGERSSGIFSIYEKAQNDKNDFIIMQAIIFPGINILWSGCIIMVIGSLLAVAGRLKRKA